jgi:hypothetical protein
MLSVPEDRGDTTLFVWLLRNAAVPHLQTIRGYAFPFTRMPHSYISQTLPLYSCAIARLRSSGVNGPPYDVSTRSFGAQVAPLINKTNVLTSTADRISLHQCVHF